MIDTTRSAGAICMYTCYIESDLLLLLRLSYDAPLLLFEMHRGAEKACGLTEAIRSIISMTEEGLMRTILSV